MSSFWAYDSSFSTRLIVLFNLVIYSYTISSRSTDIHFLHLITIMYEKVEEIFHNHRRKDDDEKLCRYFLVVSTCIHTLASYES